MARSPHTGGPLDRPIDRRELLGYAGIGAGALILGGVPVDPALAKRAKRRNRIPLAKGGSFPQGVASGSPRHAGSRCGPGSTEPSATARSGSRSRGTPTSGGWSSAGR